MQFNSTMAPAPVFNVSHGGSSFLTNTSTHLHVPAKHGSFNTSHAGPVRAHHGYGRVRPAQESVGLLGYIRDTWRRVCSGQSTSPGGKALGVSKICQFREGLTEGVTQLGKVLSSIQKNPKDQHHLKETEHLKIHYEKYLRLHEKQVYRDLQRAELERLDPIISQIPECPSKEALRKQLPILFRDKTSDKTFRTAPSLHRAVKEVPKPAPQKSSSKADALQAAAQRTQEQAEKIPKLSEPSVPVDPENLGFRLKVRECVKKLSDPLDKLAKDSADPQALKEIEELASNYRFQLKQHDKEALFQYQQKHFKALEETAKAITQAASQRVLEVLQQHLPLLFKPAIKEKIEEPSKATVDVDKKESNLIKKVSSILKYVQAIFSYIDHSLSFPTASAKCTATSYPLKLNPFTIAFSPNGTQFAIPDSYLGLTTRNVWSFEIVDGELRKIGSAHGTPPMFLIQSMAFTPDGEWLITAGREINVFKATYNRLSWEATYNVPPSSERPRRLSISPDGKLLVTANSKDVTIFKIINGVLSHGISYPIEPDVLSPWGVAFSPDNTILAIVYTTLGINPDKIAVFKVRNGMLNNATIYKLPEGSRGFSGGAAVCAFSPDGSIFATANSGSHDVTVFKVENEILLKGVSFPTDTKYGPFSLAFLPNGSFLATITAGIIDYTVTPFELSDNYLSKQENIRFPGREEPQDLAFSPDGSILVTANGESDDVTLFQGCFKASQPIPIPPAPIPAPPAPLPAPTAPIPTKISLPTPTHTSPPMATDIPSKGTGGGMQCDEVCIVEIASGAFVVVVGVGIAAFLIKKYCSKAPSGEGAGESEGLLEK